MKLKFHDKAITGILIVLPLSLIHIFPVYNTEKLLPRCLESLLNQSLENIEIICVNDASPDNSLNIRCV